MSIITSLTTTQISTLDAGQIAALTTSEIRELSTNQIAAGLSTTQIVALTPAQVAAFTTDQLVNGLTTAQLAAIDDDSAVSIHPTATGVPAERRVERLASPSPDDNRVTHGCINVAPEFYEQVIRPTFERGGVFYILPDKDSLAEIFPEFVRSRATAQSSKGRRARSARR